ncbi:MAG: hypothetical protein ACLRZ2_07130 [Veillonella sp.]
MSKSFEQLGCSKINIGLAITGKREDGYHDIDSIFNPFALATHLFCEASFRSFLWWRSRIA